MAKSNIANNIKRIIKDKGLKQYVVGNKAGYSARQFNDMLNDRKVIVADDIVPISIALGCEPADLLRPCKSD